MANSVNDALQHLDAWLSVEADALTDDELLLVTDMVQQLVGGSGTATAQQQQLMSTPAGSNLAAQIEQMLPGVMQMAQQQSQQQQHQAPSTAALTAQNLQYQQAQRAQSPAGFCSYLSLNSQPKLHSSVQATDASGLASPSDSSISGRSSPVSPRSRPLMPRSLMQPQHQAPAPAAAVPAAPAQPDAAVQAAADVLTAALTNPNASIDEIVGIFDQVLTAGERDAKELQQRLTTPQPQQPAQAVQSPQAQLQQYSMHSYQQQQEPASPVLGAGSKQSAINAYLQEQRGSPEQPVLSPGSPPARSITNQWPSSRLSQQAAAAADWQQDRPSTSPAHVSSQYIGQQGGSVSLRTSSHSTTSTSPSAAMMAAAAARRSQSPDVFRRLSVMSTASATARQSAVQAPPRNSNSPIDIERNWLGTLRDSRNERSPPPIRDRSNSRSRDSSPTLLQQQQGAQEVPWLTAASVQSAHQSMSPGPMEWDADSRSIKAGSGGGWVNPNSKRRGPGQDSDDGCKAPEVPQKQPVKLPSHVIEERMRRFYARNVDWKNRCAQVYERQREQQQEGEVEECTFAPVINKKSERMAQELRTSYPMRPVRPITPLANAAEEVEQQLRKQQLLQQQRRSASTGKMRQKQQPQGWLYSAGGSAVPGFGCSSSGGADQAVPPAAKRLFQDAVVRMQRAEQTKEMTAEAERKARCWSARRRPAADGVPPRVYDHLDPVRSSSKQRGQKHAGSDECMFKPWTNPRRKPTSAQFTAAASAAVAGVRVEQENTEEVLEEFVTMLDDSAELQQQQQPCRQQRVRPGTAPAGGHQQQQPRSHSASRRIGSATKNEDLDWDEFIERQSRFIRSKQAKVAAVAEREYCSPSPELSLGTKRILRGKQALADNAGSPSHTQAYSGSPQSPQKQGQHDFLGRLQQESDSHTSTGASSSPGYSTAESPVARRAVKTSGGGVSSGKGSSGGWTSDEYTYKPRITSKAAAKKGRSFEEMSEGDRLRREVRLEQMRVLKEAKELAAATFRPDLSPSRQRAGESFAGVPAKLSLTSEGLAAYMASLQEKRRQLEERRMKAQSRKQEEELRECTFKPETTPVPAYITEMAEVGYTARYIDRVMQGALTDGRMGSTVAAVAKALKPTDGGVKEASRPATAAASSPQKPQLISTKY